ncbi:beta-N-acetylhexosaminidase [Abditibacterium utsteinense]|uniref:beta-N-acetylhexosaminidase n=1 Tax=Abditibacterium utsteinense TaxID=1960156 RepID=A0A2S8SX37_9BACT|nr:beta-N-acetylhexosaminidase [Abditibacterium utsteinense]PQV65354.1 beta-N-acetylhexosaminidase [Abditibacterium utsteinense]
MNISQLLTIGVAQDGNLDAVRELQPGGIIFFERNAKTPSEMRRVARTLNEISEIAPFIAIDHEGGRVQRLKDGYSLLPPAREVGNQGAAAVNLGAMNAAAELRNAGINLNFAPVCDVPTHPEDTIIGDRSYSDNPIRASLLAAEYVRGAQGSILCCAKHFPGHGGVGVDSHTGLPVFEGTRAELEAHLIPFRGALAAGVGSMMMAHVVVPCLDDSGAPASLSEKIVTEMLREEFGFRGLIFTDDLEMHALDQSKTGENAVRAIAAGCDNVLICHTKEKAFEAKEAIERALRDGVLSEGRVEDALSRIEWAKKRFGILKSAA